MKRFRYFFCVLLLASLLDLQFTQPASGSVFLFIADEAVGSHNSLQPSPSPELSPAEVIKIQIEALGKNDDPHENAGIGIAFRFASPANKRATGPLDRFIRMVSGPAYRPMLNHRNAKYGEIQLTDNRAVQSVVLTAQDGQKIGYVFTLSKQHSGQYAGCWMTDGVSPFDPQKEPEEPMLSI